MLSAEVSTRCLAEPYSSIRSRTLPAVDHGGVRQIAWLVGYRPGPGPRPQRGQGSGRCGRTLTQAPRTTSRLRSLRREQLHDPEARSRIGAARWKRDLQTPASEYVLEQDAGRLGRAVESCGALAACRGCPSSSTTCGRGSRGLCDAALTAATLALDEKQASRVLATPLAEFVRCASLGRPVHDPRLGMRKRG